MITPEQERLIVDNIPFIHYLVNGKLSDMLKRCEIEPEEVVQNTLTRLCAKIHTFDPEKARYSTWLARVTLNEALMLRRSRIRQSHIGGLKEIHWDDIVAEDTDGNALTIADKYGVTEGGFTNIETFDAKDLLRRSSLTPMERSVFTQWLSSEGSQSVIAQRLGLSQSYVSRLVHNARKKLRTVYERMNPDAKDSRLRKEVKRLGYHRGAASADGHAGSNQTHHAGEPVVGELHDVDPSLPKP